MAIEFSCGQCGKQLRTPDEAAGKSARCPECGAVTRIPDAAAFVPVVDFAGPALPAGPLHPGGEETTDGDPFDFNPYKSPTTTSAAPPPRYVRVERRNLASLGSRFLGNLIDTLIYLAAAIPGFFVLINAEDDRLPRRESGEEMFLEPTPGAVLFWGGVLAVAIVNWILVVQSGQSLAKKMLGMRIVRLDGTLPGFLHGVVLRSWVPGFIGAIPIAGGIFDFVDALAIFGSERRCIHDHFAGTRVIKA